MSTKEIQQRCIQLIADAKKIPPETILPSTTFEELGLDSLDRVSLAFDVEELYDITIPESALVTLQTVDDMVAGIEKAIALKIGEKVRGGGNA